MAAVADLLTNLLAFDIANYEKQVQIRGRAQLRDDTPLVTQVIELAGMSEVLHSDWTVTHCRPVDHVVETMRCFFSAQAYILTHEKPRYEPYATIELLCHILGVDSHLPLSITRRHIWTIFQRMALAHLDFEMKALTGALEPGKEQFSRSVSAKRVKALTAVVAVTPPRFRIVSKPDIFKCGTFCDIVGDTDFAATISHLLVFPQTICHDEVAFIRLIQMAESLFWGTLIFVQRALSELRTGQFEDANKLLTAASEFAAPLIKVFHCVKVMPPEHFLGFREATGDASAIQCRSWQMLDAHVYGILPEKASIIAAIPEVQHVLASSNSSFVPLIHILRRLGTSEIETTLAATIVELDHRLRAWRKFHEKQLAGKTNPGYLPAEASGSGQTSGYAYLAAQHPPKAVLQVGENDAMSVNGSDDVLVL